VPGGLAPVACDSFADLGGFIEVTDTRPLPLNLRPDRPGNDGRDFVRNVERLVFADQTLVLVAGGNTPAMGQPTISGTPEVGETLTASIDGVTDPDNVSSAGAVTSAVDWTWESELEPGSDSFSPIARLGGVNGNGDAFEVHGESMVLALEEAGLRVRVRGTFQDEDLVFEMVTSGPVEIVTPPGFVPPPGAIPLATFNRGRVAIDAVGPNARELIAGTSPEPACRGSTSQLRMCPWLSSTVRRRSSPWGSGPRPSSW
jgi:hypothetical protein